jgi:hypothetical protein
MEPYGAELAVFHASIAGVPGVIAAPPVGRRNAVSAMVHDPYRMYHASIHFLFNPDWRESL